MGFKKIPHRKNLLFCWEIKIRNQRKQKLEIIKNWLCTYDVKSLIPVARLGSPTSSRIDKQLWRHCCDVMVMLSFQRFLGMSRIESIGRSFFELFSIAECWSEEIFWVGRCVHALEGGFGRSRKFERRIENNGENSG